jgi:hypothetical protein
MAAAPGVYVALVGSGMSSAAGIPTGWQVVQDLIRRIARAEGADPSDLGERPEFWWEAQGRPDPRYDTLLPVLARTDAARQALLREFFDPPAAAGGPLSPTEAHRALARFVAAGRIRVVLTTNFDRLIERSLDEVGVAPQVISQPAAAAGMVPLVHAPATVIKLHGDYTMLGLRNTPTELGSYPPAWRRLLHRIFDEYGLLTVGWSATYDLALVRELSRSPSRRYPTFWTAFHGRLEEQASRLVALRQAAVIPIDGADEFFADLEERLRRLEAIAARRGPFRYRSHYASPPPANPPLGWKEVPLLRLRVTTVLTPADPDTTQPIRPEDRARLTTALDSASLTRLLGQMARGHQPIRASARGAQTVQPVPDAWHPTPQGHQTTADASYRLGGDASAGISALATVQLPRPGRGDLASSTVDIGLSVEGPLSLAELLAVLQAAVFLTSVVIPEAMAEALSPDAAVRSVEIHVVAEQVDANQMNRPNDLDRRIEWQPLGSLTRPLGRSIATSVEVNGPLTLSDTGALVTGALEHMALDGGALDPRKAVDHLRKVLSSAHVTSDVSGRVALPG